MSTLSLSLTMGAVGGPSSLAQRALSAIRRNGGTLLLPGAATPNGDGTFSYGNPPLRNYLDSAGTDLLDSVTQVDQPVGLALDSMGVLGAELFAGSYFVGAATTATYVGNEATATFGGSLNATANNWLSLPGAATANGYSEIEFWATYVSGGNLEVGRTWTAAQTITAASNAGVRTRYKATGFSPNASPSAGRATFGSTTAGSVWKIEIISVREIPGSHASQPTTASKPLLRRTDGRYSWQWDGSNDFLQTGITTGNEGWVCAGVNFQGAGVNETIFANGAGSSAQKGVWLVRIGQSGENIMRMGIGNGTALTMPIVNTLPLQLRNTPRVVEGGWTADSVFVTVDGTTTNTLARTGDAATPPQTTLIGAYLSGIHSLQGSMSATVYTPVLPSAADRALIRRFVGSLQGQQL